MSNLNVTLPDGTLKTVPAGSSPMDLSPWPKLPAEAQVSRFTEDGNLAAKYSAPRPLNDRMGLMVSTLRKTRTRVRRLSDSASYWGVLRKTGSMMRLD